MASLNVGRPAAGLRRPRAPAVRAPTPRVRAGRRVAARAEKVGGERRWDAMGAAASAYASRRLRGSRRAGGGAAPTAVPGARGAMWPPPAP